MDRKGSKKQWNNPARSKKRKFQGNRHTVEQETTFASTSAEKLRRGGLTATPIMEEFGYCIISFLAVFSAISDNVICKVCKKDAQFSQTDRRGIGFKILMQCECGDRLMNSCPMIDNAYEINRRLVFVMRILGVGHTGLNTFCGLMDICKGVTKSTYYACLDNLHIAASAVYDSVLKNAVQEEKEKNKAAGKPESHFIVSGDGTWKKRGFSSLFGVSTLIGYYSKKVVDTVVKSSFCQACNMWNNKKDSAPDEYNEWYENHKDKCTINHKGSAGKMEIDGITEMFLRSEKNHGAKYGVYIGDGDSKTFKGILDANPYGDEIIVQKRECVGHVKKRMGTRLRNAKKANKSIGGKGAGKLTDKVIGELTTFYGLAIRRNPDSVTDMREAIWATYYHRSSSDDKPQHMKCPPGADSWCKWRKAEAANTLHAFKHSQAPLDAKVLKVLKPIYEDLSSDDLLKRCLGAHTQNSNESLNSLIWSFAPKHVHSGSTVVEIATFLAVIIFNEGYKPLLKVMKTMGITVGQQSEMYADNRDGDRIDRSEHRVSDGAKKARIEHREEKAAQLESFEEEEGRLYGPGIAD